MQVSEYLPEGQSFPVHLLAKALHVTQQHVINLVDSGQIAAVDLRGAGSSRSTIRISRAAAIEFLEKRIVVAPAS